MRHFFFSPRSVSVAVKISYDLRGERRVFGARQKDSSGAAIWSCRHFTVFRRFTLHTALTGRRHLRRIVGPRRPAQAQHGEGDVPPARSADSPRCAFLMLGAQLVNSIFVRKNTPCKTLCCNPSRGTAPRKPFLFLRHRPRFIPIPGSAVYSYFKSAHQGRLLARSALRTSIHHWSLPHLTVGGAQSSHATAPCSAHEPAAGCASVESRPREFSHGHAWTRVPPTKQIPLIMMWCTCMSLQYSLRAAFRIQDMYELAGSWLRGWAGVF